MFKRPKILINLVIFGLFLIGLGFYINNTARENGSTAAEKNKVLVMQELRNLDSLPEIELKESFSKTNDPKFYTLYEVRFSSEKTEEVLEYYKKRYSENNWEFTKLESSKNPVLDIYVFRKEKLESKLRVNKGYLGISIGAE